MGCSKMSKIMKFELFFIELLKKNFGRFFFPHPLEAELQPKTSQTVKYHLCPKMFVPKVVRDQNILRNNLFVPLLIRVISSSPFVTYILQTNTVRALPRSCPTPFVPVVTFAYPFI